jgi:hypothetical protein
MSSTIQNIKSRITVLIDEVKQLSDANDIFSGVEDLQNFEEQIYSKATELSDYISALKLQKSLYSESLKTESSQLASYCPYKMKNMGYRKLNIRFAGGTLIEIEATYYCRKSRQNKLKQKGFYPGFLLLGIYEQCSVSFISKIGVLVTSCCSFEESKHLCSVLLGYKIEINKMYTIAKNLARRSKFARDNNLLEFRDSCSDLIITVSVDGGRIRIRKDRVDKKTGKGRKRYHTDWREPKLMTIYAVDKDGKRNKVFNPIIDGSISGPDTVFSLLIFYLRKIGVANIKKILFVSDGAKWIWNRVSTIIEKLGIPSERFFTLLDYYHMAEHLSSIATLLKIKKKEADKWIKKIKELFLEGRTNEAIKAIKDITIGSRNKELRRERNYFLFHWKGENLNYRQVKNENLPIGSGAIESVIRRVVNLRLKGCGIFWKKENADAMLLLRSFYKAGRWEMLMDMGVKGALAMVTSDPQ